LRDSVGFTPNFPHYFQLAVAIETESTFSTIAWFSRKQHVINNKLICVVASISNFKLFLQQELNCFLELRKDAASLVYLVRKIQSK
jgi:alpha-galactosidase